MKQKTLENKKSQKVIVQKESKTKSSFLHFSSSLILGSYERDQPAWFPVESHQRDQPAWYPVKFHQRDQPAWFPASSPSANVSLASVSFISEKSINSRSSYSCRRQYLKRERGCQLEVG